MQPPAIWAFLRFGNSVFCGEATCRQQERVCWPTPGRISHTSGRASFSLCQSNGRFCAGPRGPVLQLCRSAQQSRSTTVSAQQGPGEGHRLGRCALSAMDTPSGPGPLRATGAGIGRRSRLRMNRVQGGPGAHFCKCSQSIRRRFCGSHNRGYERLSGPMASRALTKRFRLTPDSAACIARARCVSGGTRIMNFPL